MQQTGGKKVFYGWYIVIGGAIITGAGIGIFSNCLGVFVKPVCEALGFSRGQFTLYSTISAVSAMMMLPWYGEMFRKRAMKNIMLCSSICCGLVPLGYSFCTKLWQFYLFAFINGVMINGITMMAIGVLVNNWFSEKKGIATGIAYSGSGLTAAIMVPVVGRVIETYGWQWGYRLLGLLGMSILVPTVLMIIKITPEEMNLKPLGADKQQGDGAIKQELYGLTRNEAVKTTTFFLLMAAFFTVGFGVSGMQQHTIPYLTDIGYSSAFANSIVSALMTAMICGKMGLGALFDRFGTLIGSIVGGLTILASAILLHFAGIPIIPWVYAFFIGISAAVGSVPTNYLTGAYFGNKEFSRIYSIITMATSLGSAIGVPLSGWIYDQTGSYMTAWHLYVCSSALGVLLLILAHFSSRKIVLED